MPVLPLRRLLWAVLFVTLIAPPGVAGAPAIVERAFVITAYYSPLPNQCCYVRGTYAADTLLNGKGIAGADGTGVYPGMAAAPQSYEFGTRIALPGIGTVTVHDRGGAITELETGAHRLDLWMGYGEEGLARALAFGVQRVQGTVYPLGASQPAELLALSSFPAPLGMIRPYLREEPDLLALHPQIDEKSVAVELLQQHLIDLGYLHEAASGWFGPATKTALMSFLDDMHLAEPSEELTSIAAAYLIAANARKKERNPIAGIIERGSPPTDIIAAKRTLRFLGYFRGRTNGDYDDALFDAIFVFQKDRGLVGDASSPGAGRIGPKTRQTLLLSWRLKHIERHAEKLLLVRAVDQELEKRGDVLAEFLAEGDRGAEVKKLQSLLADRGFFPRERVSGLFGTVTRDAVLQYQIDRKIIEKVTDTGAGFVGPATIASLKREEKTKLLRLVRSEGLHIMHAL